MAVFFPAIFTCCSANILGPAYPFWLMSDETFHELYIRELWMTVDECESYPLASGPQIPATETKSIYKKKTSYSSH